MNVSDTVLNMSKEGGRLVGLLQECCTEIAVGTSAEKYLKMTAVLEEIRNLFHSITEASAAVNDISHKIEGEVAYQKQVEENIKNHLSSVGESLDSVVACAELMIAEL
jgi:predicted phage-related endonuclease